MVLPASSKSKQPSSSTRSTSKRGIVQPLVERNNQPSSIKRSSIESSPKLPQRASTKDKFDLVDTKIVDNADNDQVTEYVVEKIIDKRRNRHGREEYFLKWKNFAVTENTWEPSDNLDCAELIAEFECERRRKYSTAAARRSRKNADISSGGGSTTIIDANKTAQKILGASRTFAGDIEFLIKWHESDECELIAARIANEHFPQLVIDYYQSRVQMNPPD